MNAEKFSCIQQVVKTVKIPLWDMYTTNEYKGIEAALDKWKRQYEKQVGGIVVNYKNISVPSRLGFHSDRGSYAIYNVKATFDVFCPKIGEIVKGKINRVSSEHIGCLIEETINVTIRLPKDSPCGLSKYIYLDREILFEIKSFSCKPRALCVDGEITEKCIEFMDEYYPVTEEFSSYENGSQDVFGDVSSDGEDDQVNLSILGTNDGTKKEKKRGRNEDGSPVKKIKVSDGDATDSPKAKKVKGLHLMDNLEEDSSSTDASKKVKKKKSNSTDSPKVKKIQKDLNATDDMEFTKEESSSTDTPKKGKKKTSNSTDSPKLSQESNSSSTNNLKKDKIVSNSTAISQIPQESDSSATDSSKQQTKKVSNSTDSPKKVKKKDSNSTDSPKKVKKKNSKSRESPIKIKKELSSTEEESSTKKSKKKQKKKNKDSSKSKDKKKHSKKKGKITASGDVLKKDKKKSKKSSKKDDKSKTSKKSKKNNKKDKSEKRKSKKIKLSNDSDADVYLKEIKPEEV